MVYYRIMRRRHLFWACAGIILLNFIAIDLSVRMGIRAGNISMLFQERETVTFLSALQLGLISLLSLFIYSIRRILDGNVAEKRKGGGIWLIAFFVFAFATIDEYFMLHEGIDGDIFTFFWGITENPHLDGITLGLYGVVALALFFRFKEELLRHKKALALFCFCGFFFLLSILLDLKSIDSFRIVLEESSKLMAVGFLLAGYVSVLSDVMAELATRVKPPAREG